MPRKYEKRARAETEAQTRQRIVDATVALHEEVGPARTTVAEIARRAGVQRLTVYNHFPEDADLFAACSGHWTAQHPPPDPGPWAAVEDPDTRLRRAIVETYAWYSDNEAMIGHSFRDAQVLPALAAVVAAGRADYDAAVRSILLAGRPKRDGPLIALALDFPTWWRLVRLEGLSPARAANLLVSRSSG